MHIKFSWNFHQNVFTLTIYFIALNVAIVFVLIYRPHPVQYPPQLDYKYWRMNMEHVYMQMLILG